MVGIEERQITVVDLLVDLTYITDELDQSIFLAGFLRLAEFLVDVAESGSIFGIRHSRKCPLIETGGFPKLALRDADLREPGEGTVIPGESIKRREIGCCGTLQIARLVKFFAELELAPGDILGGHVRFDRRAHRAVHELDGALRIAGYEPKK